VKCYFIYASGGCGKTFLLNLILREFRASGHIAIATAFTGIAAPVE
jgi:chromosomal replication initiation ATPase DnaA